MGERADEGAGGAMRARRPLGRAALSAVALTLLVGHAGHCGDEGIPLRSRAHVVAWALEHEDGRVETRLVAFSTATSTPSAIPLAQASVAVEGEEHALASDGAVYWAEGLGYDPDAPFVFALAIAEADAAAHLVEGGSFSLALHGPLERPDVWLERAGEVVSLAWEPAGMPLYVETLAEDGARVWSNLEAPRGEHSWSLPRGTITLPDEALAGARAVVACGCEVARTGGSAAPSATPQHAAHASLAGSLGWMSGVVVGRCRTLALP